MVLLLLLRLIILQKSLNIYVFLFILYIKKIASEDNVRDMVTKSLGRVEFIKHRLSLNLYYVSLFRCQVFLFFQK